VGVSNGRANDHAVEASPPPSRSTTTTTQQRRALRNLRI
jgi:hypothetical protein